MNNHTTSREQMLEMAWKRFYELNLDIVFKRRTEGKNPHLIKTGVLTPADMHLQERLKQCCEKHNFEFKVLDCRQVSSRQAVMRFYKELANSPDCLVLLDHLSSLCHQTDCSTFSNLLVHAWKNPNITLDNGDELNPRNYLVIFAFDADADADSLNTIWHAGDGFGWYGDMLKL